MDDIKDEIRDRLMETLSKLNQDRVEQKRRRIETHFKQKSQITGAAFTIASEGVRETVMGGYFLRLNAAAPLKPFPLASEGYCLDTAHAHILSPVFYALTTLYFLDVAHVPVSMHFVSIPAMERFSQLISGESSPKDLIEEGICFLCKQLPRVEVLSCIKGAFFEKMQSKIYMMKRHNINEQVALDFAVIAEALLSPVS